MAQENSAHPKAGSSDAPQVRGRWQQLPSVTHEAVNRRMVQEPFSSLLRLRKPFDAQRIDKRKHTYIITYVGGLQRQT